MILRSRNTARLKAVALSSASVFASLLATQPAWSQASTASAESVGEVVVTGSRVIRDGYSAPTPLTVLNQEVLQARADINVADAINQLPQASNSVTQTSQPTAVSGGAVGVNQISLRGLGPTRTLILQDGKRVINSSITTALAAPDINHVPNALVSRVDVVTGGASAAYGSDALSGVVNFILDHKFTGLKGELVGGSTTHGDNESYLASLAGGANFGPEGRGHVMVSGELAFNDGVDGNPRSWAREGGGIFTNPAYTATNGQPFYLVGKRIGLSNATPGGLITRGPLRGVVFGPGGTPSVFNFGLVSTNNAMQGGDWEVSRLDDGYDLVSQNRRHVVFGRLSYQLSEALNIYGEYQWAKSHDSGTANPYQRRDNLTIQADNAFIPASIRARLATLGLTNFVIGSTNADIGRVVVKNVRELDRWALGGDGLFALAGTDWAWDAYYQQSRNIVDSAATNTIVDTGRYLAAVDAVISPTTGGIVCRSTLTNPTNGCVPYNALGIGVNQRGAIDYVTGTNSRHDVMKQKVAALNVGGEPFSTWAGPVSLALGIEHRRESVGGTASFRDPVTGGGYRSTIGAYKVTEGYAETVIPLAKDVSWAKSLEVTAAARLTDYSTSGTVKTWKVGGTYAPINDIRFRLTRSRDIRAPNIGELFAGGQAASGANIIDPFTNTTVTGVVVLRRGNPVLEPEVANTLGLGVVLAPSFAPGLQASIDYYKIKISGAVKIPNEQTIVDLCRAGNQAVCPFIERTNGVITLISTPPANVLSQDAEGFDFAVSYGRPLSDFNGDWRGNVSLSANANYVISLKNADTTGVSQGAGVVGNFGGIVSSGPFAPRFRSSVRLGYDYESFTAAITWRYVAPETINHILTECASACPADNRLTISDNRVSSDSLFDLAFSYKPLASQDATVFIAVDNIFDKAPPFVPGQVDIAYFTGQYTIGYNRVGRTIRAGLRFKL